jgi:Flp pilus assembly protein TadB
MTAARWWRWSGWWWRVGAWVGRRTPPAGLLAAPAADLRLLGIDPAAFAGTRAGAAAAGLAAPTLLWTLAGLAGLLPATAVPAALGVGLAAAGWLLPTVILGRRAGRARAGLRVALSAYLDLVALERAGAGSPVEALETAAAVGHGPAFALLRGRLALAARSGASPYTALAELADEVDVAELRDLADLAATAADGAAIYTTLLAKSRSLRNAIAADTHAAANAASERLVFPVVLLGTGFLLLLFYPALADLLSTG